MLLVEQRSAIPGIGIEVLTMDPVLVLVLGIDLGHLEVLVLVLGIDLSHLEVLVLVLGIDLGHLAVLVLVLGIDLGHLEVLVLVLGIDLSHLEVLVLVLTSRDLVLLTSGGYSILDMGKSRLFILGRLTAVNRRGLQKSTG